MRNVMLFITAPGSLSKTRSPRPSTCSRSLRKVARRPQPLYLQTTRRCAPTCCEYPPTSSSSSPPTPPSGGDGGSGGEASASGSSGSSSSATPEDAGAAAVDAKDTRLELWQEVIALRKSLTIAVNAERFADAARLRDQIEQLSQSDDYVRVETALNRAVSEQRFADAARLRDELQSLEPPPSLAALGAPPSSDGGKSSGSDRVGSRKTGDATSAGSRATAGSSTAAGDAAALRKAMADMGPEDVAHFSETTTEGMIIRAECFYDKERSIPAEDRYQFGYVIKITNNTTETCQLVSRHWIISSCVGSESEVKGPGVVGRQPVLEPGASFEYESQCPITAPVKDGQIVVGNMRGHFHFCKGATGDIKFVADINPFYFKLPPS